ncbi:MAG: redox-regulated ATPase YchF [Peptococcaceae bacterium]|jgi:GTP-binding protein YchF|nr:redox-regulated ATPase YchF [Peptococcaceae bacterium]
MKIGLIGLAQTGKTTLFHLLTGRGEDGQAAGAKGAAGAGIGFVPDSRIDFLSRLYTPKKTTYAQIELTDVAGFVAVSEGQKSGAAKFLNDVRPCEALAHTLRAFGGDGAAAGEIDPARDLETVETEMLFADLELVEKRIGRIKGGKKITKENGEELALLERCFAWLEDGGATRDMALTDEERNVIRNYAFLTAKPRLAVVNLDEALYKSKDYPHRAETQALCQRLNIPLLELCAGMELEISRLPDEDKALFMEDLGLTEPGISVLARAAYEHLGLISFLTAGEDEVRAWTITAGTSARAAAGKIHSDIERGFIRAEVVKFADLRELGSMAKVKEKGLFRLEGKEYIVADGDIINFRFNV